MRCGTPSPSLIPTSFACRSPSSTSLTPTNANPSFPPTSPASTSFPLTDPGGHPQRLGHRGRHGGHPDPDHLLHHHSVHVHYLRLNLLHHQCLRPLGSQGHGRLPSGPRRHVAPNDMNWLLIGDFNRTRAPVDKNNANFDQGWQPSSTRRLMALP